MTTVNDVANNMLKAARAYDAATANELANADTPSLEALAYRLRHPETWPAGFEWAYKDCQQCALGLAFRLWHPMGIDAVYGHWYRFANEALGVSDKVTDRIFGGGQWECPNDRITPEMVATAIEALLRRRCRAKARRALKKAAVHV